MGKYIGIIGFIVIVFVCSAFGVTSIPENIAPKAKISADSQYSGDYLAKFVADGQIPNADAKNDPQKAWAVQGGTHRNAAELTFQWDTPTPVAEIIYYGRTAWFLSECFKDYELYADDQVAPLLKGRLEARQGPQRITLAEPQHVRKLRLKFTSSYGGPNPGASEIQIFSRALSDDSWREMVETSILQSNPYYRTDTEILNKPASRRLRQDLIAGRLGFESLIVIQRHPTQPSHVYTYHNEGFQAGGGLYVFTPDEKGGSLRQLVAAPEGQILDCDLSYDATEILFSWRKSVADLYQLYRMNIDGTGLSQITNHESYNFNGSWLPDGSIVFLSTRKPAFAYCWTSPVGILYRTDRDGKETRRISANYLNDFTPSVMNDGRIIYGRWEYVDRPAIPIQSLWTINPDGTNLAIFYGNRVLSPATFIEPQAIPNDTRILCTMTAHNGPCRGAIGIIQPNLGVNAQNAIRNLTPEVDIGSVDRGDGNHIRGPYESPYPLDSQLFLVSREGTILLRDYDGDRQITVLGKKDGIGFYNPRPIRPRPRPPIHPSVLPENPDNWATVILQDVYHGLEPHVKRGEIKQICVVQEIEKSKMADTRYRAFGFQFPVVSCGATYAPKKVWGFVPVADDGSACFKAPANVPLYFMAIDAKGRAVQRMRSFTHFMPGQIQGCVGCHEPRNHSPRLWTRPAAVTRAAEPPQPPSPPEWAVRGFSYADIVQPVLDRHCIACHSGQAPPRKVDLSGDETDFFNVSYETLARQGRPGENPYTKWIPTFNGQEANILIVTPKSWGSPASKLADIVLSGHPDMNGKARVNLSDTERRRIFTWIDLNVPYYGTSLSNYYERIGCRQMIPADFESVFQEVARRRCASCHKADDKGTVQVPRKVWLRITHPELNNFLLATLAKDAGGTQQCGSAVFESGQDPDYKAILKTFEPMHEMLKRQPRMDMAGAYKTQPNVTRSN
ncbi:MAG: PD40 domain-containing protein [Sedimentisphaerales bacterium]|nr:PD40 domain-containing protein [Sedimentisphaerales bacterium]